jgi:hypothetical protein
MAWNRQEPIFLEHLLRDVVLQEKDERLGV